MIRRLIHHCFWNFYDYLGMYLLVGVTTAFLLMGYLFGGMELIRQMSGGYLQWAGFALLGAGFLTLFGASCAGLFPFASKAAHDLPARWPDLINGLRRRSKLFIKLAFALGFVLALIAVNVLFYFRLTRGYSSATQLVASAAGAMFLWLGLTVVIALFSIFAAAGKYANEPAGIKAAMREGFIACALSPGIWLAVFSMALFVIAFGFLSRVGIIFILPAVACIATTANRLVTQHAQLLTTAREQLGAGKPVSAYKKRAIELGLEWEYRQPRRTFRELIKPWEY